MNKENSKSFHDFKSNFSKTNKTSSSPSEDNQKLMDVYGANRGYPSPKRQERRMYKSVNGIPCNPDSQLNKPRRPRRYTLLPQSSNILHTVKETAPKKDLEWKPSNFPARKSKQSFGGKIIEPIYEQPVIENQSSFTFGDTPSNSFKPSNSQNTFPNGQIFTQFAHKQNPPKVPSTTPINQSKTSSSTQKTKRPSLRSMTPNPSRLKTNLDFRSWYYQVLYSMLFGFFALICVYYLHAFLQENDWSIFKMPKIFIMGYAFNPLVLWTSMCFIAVLGGLYFYRKAYNVNAAIYLVEDLKDV